MSWVAAEVLRAATFGLLGLYSIAIPLFLTWTSSTKASKCPCWHINSWTVMREMVFRNSPLEMPAVQVQLPHGVQASPTDRLHLLAALSHGLQATKHSLVQQTCRVAREEYLKLIETPRFIEERECPPQGIESAYQ